MFLTSVHAAGRTHSGNRWHLLAVIFLLTFIAAASPGSADDRPNVLFIAVDDLAVALGTYGHPLAKTPAIDRLAAQGVRFHNAYCQLPLCNPSRASVLTGMRPDQIRVYDLDRHFRDQMPGVLTLPQLFRQDGWRVARVGKLFHYNVPAGIGTNGLDDPGSWDQVINPKGRDVAEESLIFNPTPQRPISAAMSWLAAEGRDVEQTDGLIASEALRLMAETSDKPFFLGVGFFRPHTPYVAPKQYFDLYPLESIQLPTAPEGDRDDIPPIAFAHNCLIPNYGLDELTCRQALQAYLACVSFVDAQVARLLDGLNELGLKENTIVVLWSDHGYHLGEHEGVWQKRTLFEESARSPLIMSVPDRILKNLGTSVVTENDGGVQLRRATARRATSGNGTACHRIVEFVDIYPTVAALCGLRVPDTAAGRSLVPLLRDPGRNWESVAVTQVVRPGDGSPVMGRSVRTERWRYTEWDGGEAGRELYDHQNDPSEFDNLADQPEHRQLIRRLRKEFDGKADAMVPDSPINPARL
ncbi:MAG: sulfatase [Planctomycetaceae bacterium]|nr:sulfatase [Planctomycetaceae bacterium]